MVNKLTQALSEYKAAAVYGFYPHSWDGLRKIL